MLIISKNGKINNKAKFELARNRLLEKDWSADYSSSIYDEYTGEIWIECKTEKVKNDN